VRRLLVVSRIFPVRLHSRSASTLLTILGGRVDDLTPFLLEERLPDGWESRVRSKFGLTFLTFNKTVFKVEHGIEEGKTDDAPHVPDVDA
jgi:hypothetical protein